MDEEEPGESGFCRPTRNVIHGKIDMDGLARMMDGRVINNCTKEERGREAGSEVG